MDTHGQDGDHDETGGGGLRSFVMTVLVLFAVIVAIVALIAWLGGGGGLLPFDYEGA